MAINLGNAILYFIGDQTGINKALGDVEKKVASTTAKLGKQLNSWGNALTIGVTAPLVAFGAASIKAASDLSETVSKTTVIFGESSDALMKWGDEAAKAYGLSKRAALDAASMFGNLFKTMGIPLEQTTEMSRKITELGADLASFFNVPVEEALASLRSGLVGEAEPMRKFGVLLNEAAVKAKALEMGLWAGTGEISEQAKVMARYQIILDQTKDAQGDFARTSDGLANSTRIAQAQFENLKASLGKNLKPVAIEAMKLLNGILEMFNGLSPATQAWIVKIGVLLAALGPILKVLGWILSLLAKIGPVLVRFGGWLLKLAPAAAGITKLFGGGGGLTGVLQGMSWALGTSVVAVGGLIAAVIALGAVIIYFRKELWQLLQDTIGFAKGWEEVFMRFFAQVLTDWQAFIQSLQIYWDEFYVWWGGLWANIVHDLINACNELGRQLSEWWASVKAEWNTWAGDALENAKRIGTAIVDGIKEGISAAWESLTTYVGDAIDNLLEWIREKIGAGSPSKLFADLVGNPMGQGVGVGFLRGLFDQMGLMGAAVAAAPAMVNNNIRRSYQVGHIEYHGAFSQGEMDRFSRVQQRMAEDTLLEALS